MEDILKYISESDTPSDTCTSTNYWNKMSKTDKLKYFKVFSNEYTINNNIKDKKMVLYNFLKFKLEQNRLNNHKDIKFSIKENKIISIPLLEYNNNKFILKRSEKRKSTLKSLQVFRKL